jgi:hypothetical protein
MVCPVYTLLHSQSPVHARDLQTQIVLGRSEHVYVFPSQDVNSPDVIFCYKPAVSHNSTSRSLTL